MDRTLYSDDDFIEVDIDPTRPENEEDNEMVEEFGWERVDLAQHFLHRYRLYKMRILRPMDLDYLDLVAFMLIEEEQSLKQTEQSAKMQQKET